MWLVIALLIVVIILIMFYNKEKYFSCRDCPSDKEWPVFTTQDITVLNPFLWPYSALPTYKGSEKFSEKKTETMKSEPDHSELTT